jgi:hypothetical protein
MCGCTDLSNAPRSELLGADLEAAAGYIDMSIGRVRHHPGLGIIQGPVCTIDIRQRRGIPLETLDCSLLEIKRRRIRVADDVYRTGALMHMYVRRMQSASRSFYSSWLDNLFAGAV